MQRRSLLKILSLSFFGIISGLLYPLIKVMAWNEQAFAAKTLTDALSDMFGNNKIQESDAIEIDVYPIVENGAIVPIKINTTLEQVQTISILVEQNPYPLIATFHLTAQCKSLVATRIKMNKHSNIIAVVQADGQYYKTSRYVEVLAGGC